VYNARQTARVATVTLAFFAALPPGATVAQVIGGEAGTRPAVRPEPAKPTAARSPASLCAAVVPSPVPAAAAPG